MRCTLLILGLVLVTQTVGCSSSEPGPAVLLPLVHGTPVINVRHCVDGTGHVPGTVPFAFDGDCCCTPDMRLLEAWRDAGLPNQVTLKDVVGRYQEMGIVTGLDHQGCNNRCVSGPHVVLGGSCMAPPTPATRNYEMVISGRFDQARLVPKGDSE